MEKQIIDTLLAHAYYSFSEIDWDFNKLTVREKCLIKNQEMLDRIRDATIISKRGGER